MQDNQILRKYADIINDNQLNESIGSGMTDVIVQRLTKTRNMVDGLINELNNDEAPNAIRELSDLSQILDGAIKQATTIDHEYGNKQ